MRSKNTPATGPLPPFGALPLGEKPPRQRNRRILVWFRRVLPALILIGVVGLALLILQFTAWRGVAAGQTDRWEAAEGTFSKQQTLTGWWPAPWVAEYNRGTALLHLGGLEEGRALLERAFESVPKAVPDSDGKIQAYTYECQVRINLAVSWEVVGDDLVAAGDPQGAVAEYDRGLEWADPCQLVGESGGGSDDDSESQPQPQPSAEEQEGASTAERIEEKRDRAQREASGEEDPAEPNTDGPEADQPDEGDQEEDPFAGETAEEKERREELEKRNQDQAEREREKDESESGRGGSRGW